MTEVVMEIPRCCSMAIQSEVAWRSDLRDLTVPATSIALPISSRRSVMVVLPASGWEMLAKVRRLATSFSMLDMLPVRFVLGEEAVTGVGRLRAGVNESAHIVAYSSGHDKVKSARHPPAAALRPSGSAGSAGHPVWSWPRWRRC